MLQAATNKLVDSFLLQKEFIEDLEKNFGSPLNILFPQSFSENVSEFKNVLEKYDLKYKIFYAHKSNTSKVFVRSAKNSEIGIDVASENEFKNALENGFSSENIEASGPKSEEFLRLCIENNILIGIDSFSEMESILKIRCEKSNVHRPVDITGAEKTKILIRLCGFKNSKISRFGIEISKKDEIINFLKKYENDFKFEGFSMHIDTTSAEEKGLAIEEILNLQIYFSKNGFASRKLNIGGGFLISLLKNYEEWEEYLFKEYDGENLVWNNLKLKDLLYYHPFTENIAEKFLDKILNFKLQKFGNISVLRYLKENFITLYLEPGRALHQNTGMTIAKVISVKESFGEKLIIVDLNINTLGARNGQLISHPILLEKNNSKEKSNGKGFFIAGNLCMEKDFVYQNKVFLENIPQVGDLLCFLNTGGYFMNFHTTNSILQKAPTEIEILKTSEKFEVLEN